MSRTQEYTELLTQVLSLGETRQGENELTRALAALVAAVETGRKVQQSLGEYVAKVSQAQTWGINAYYTLVEASEALRTAGLAPTEGEGIHAAFFPHLPLILEPDSCSDIWNKARHIGACLKGLVEFNPQSGGLSVTSKGKRMGLTSGGLRAYVAVELEKAYPELRAKAYSTPYLCAVLEEAARRYLATQGPYDELMGAVALHPGLGVPLKTEVAPNLKDTGASFDGVKAFLSELTEQMTGGTGEREMQVLAKLLTALAARSVSPGCPLQWALVIQGLGGCCKTGFAQSLALDSAPYVDVDHTVLEARGLAPTIGASVLGLDEVDTITSRRDLADFKSFLTRNRHLVRLPYRRDPEEIPASYVVICTTNDETGLQDDGAQNRRFVALRFPGGPAEGARRYCWLQANRSRLHAAAMLLYKAGFNWDLTAQDIQDNSSTTQAMIAEPEGMGALIPRIPALEAIISENPEQTPGFNARQIWSMFSPAGERWASRKAAPIIAELKKLGWVQQGRHRSLIPRHLAGAQVVPAHEDQVLRVRAILASSVVD